MKILFTHRYFWPDTPPYALMLRSIAEGIQDKGHTVQVYASKPSYRAISKNTEIKGIDGLDVKRAFVFSEQGANFIVRFLNVLLYCAGLFIHILRTRPDIVTAATFPPVIAAWTASLASKIVGAKFVYHMQDVHPEVSRFSGGRLGQGVPFKLLQMLDNQTLRRSALVVVLSQDMVDTLNARGLKKLPIDIINNFLLDDFEATPPVPEDLAKPKGVKRIIFAGNLGKFQNLDVLANGIVHYLNSDPSTELFFLGDGVAAKELKQKWSDNKQVKFAPFLPYSSAKAIIEAADVGLVSLREDIYRVSYPSKVLTYLGLGIPVFVLIEPDSTLAKLVLRDRLGVVPLAPDVESISNAIGNILTNLPTKEHLASWHNENTTAAVAIERWTKVFHGLL